MLNEHDVSAFIELDNTEKSKKEKKTSFMARWKR
ncbi:Uncharacterised protein [Legionella sainthelensi]|nr:Uncharacterised protein [Legionella sainthelensi]